MKPANAVVSVCGILAITSLVALAIINDVNGMILALGLAAISGISGYGIAHLLNRR